MITNRDLDRQLGTWFESRATSLPPEGLFERALADVNVTKQRPGWLVPDFWRSGDGRTRPTSRPARVALVIVSLLVVAMAATAVGAWLNRPSALIVPPAPSPSAELSATPSASAVAPSPTEHPTSTPDTATGVPASAFSNQTAYLLASDTVGWVSTTKALYRTRDAGKTWTDVGRKGWSTVAVLALIDADTAYATSWDAPTTIAVTHDGGGSWQEVKLDTGAYTDGPIFSFDSASTGFATFFGARDFHVYGTTDGGATWTGPVAGTVPHLAASMDKLNGPLGGFLYQSAGKADNKPFDNRFFLSADGGATWTDYVFPIGPLSPKGGMKQILGIVREDNGRFLLATDGKGGGYAQTIWESGDDPATWRLVETLPSGAVNIQFLSPTTWVAFSQAPSEVHSTVDGGAHWRTITAAISLYYMGAQFATPDTGWASQDCHKSWDPVGLCDKGRDGSVLGVTTDGGKTWTRIGD